AAVSLEGGTVKALAGNATSDPYLAPFQINATGSAIDTNGFDMAISTLTAANAPAGTEFHKKAAGTLTVNGLTTLDRDTTFFVDAGTFKPAGDISPLASQTSFHVESGATLDLAGAPNAWITSLTGGGDVRNFEALTIDHAPQSEFSGRLFGTSLSYFGFG